jgi:hypothetical protein
MADVDLSTLTGDEFVFHFGGRPREVDAYTFANSLIAFSEAIREINKQVNPNTKLEIAIEGVGEGSFRAKLKATATSISGLLRGTIATGIVLPLLVTYIYDRYLSDDKTNIVINDESYVITRGHDRIILPRSIYDQKQRMRDPAAIERHIARGFSVLDEDPSVTEFGITKNLDDPKPAATIPRQDFPVLSQYAVVQDLEEGQRILEQREKLVVLRVILTRSARKWQFVWNGIQISAAITDTQFFDALARHEYEFGQGDVLDVILKIFQRRHEDTGIYINTGYEVSRVFGRQAGPRQQPLPLRQPNNSP